MSKPADEWFITHLTARPLATLPILEEPARALVDAATEMRQSATWTNAALYAGSGGLRCSVRRKNHGQPWWTAAAKGRVIVGEFDAK